MKKYQVGAYYFPNYHIDPRNEMVHGPGWSEWELVKHSTPRFPCHQQPNVPLWGYLDEADPKVMERKLAAAAEHGVDYLIFDWYYYDDGPFLQRCLEEGYMGASNNHLVKFCCMWANHDWINIHPAGRTGSGELLYPGKVTPQTFETIVKHVIENYFKHPSHFKVEGCPYFSIYDLSKMLENFGGVMETREAMNAFRDQTKVAGFTDLHLNAVVWGRPVLPAERTPADPVKLVREIGFDSVTSYVWIHHVPLDQSPFTSYTSVQEKYFEHWDRMCRDYDVPYFPNVTMGWDSSPRTIQSEVWEPVGYPYTNIISQNTPQAFREALAATKDRLDSQGSMKILNINCWNEWTEGSYLEPDIRNGTAYLEAIKQVFGHHPASLLKRG